jgi:hypothetical protein
MNLTREQVKEAVDRAAWDTGRECPACRGSGKLPGGQRVVHALRGGFGADWDVNAVKAAIDAADEVVVEFGAAGLGHHLVVRRGDEITRFEVDVSNVTYGPDLPPPGMEGCGFCFHPPHTGRCGEPVTALGVETACECVGQEAASEDLHPGSRACERCLAENREQFVQYPTICPHYRDEVAKALRGPEATE